MYKIRLAEPRDARVIRENDLILQEEISKLVRKSDLKQFAELELRDHKTHSIKDYQNWFNSMKKTATKKMNNIWYVLEINEQVVGHIYAEIKINDAAKIKRTGHLDAIYIEPKYRSKGYGSKLMRKVLSWYKQQGIEYIDTFIDVPNISSKKLFEKFGFVINTYVCMKKIS
jgi:predicted acetyltransferase